MPEEPINITYVGAKDQFDSNRIPYEVTAEVSLRQTGNPEKLLFLLELRFEDGHKECQIRYRSDDGQQGRMVDTRSLKRHPAVAPLADLQNLVQRAVAEGWLCKFRDGTCGPSAEPPSADVV